MGLFGREGSGLMGPLGKRIIASIAGSSATETYQLVLSECRLILSSVACSCLFSVIITGIEIDECS